VQRCDNCTRILTNKQNRTLKKVHRGNCARMSGSEFINSTLAGYNVGRSSGPSAQTKRHCISSLNSFRPASSAKRATNWAQSRSVCCSLFSRCEFERQRIIISHTVCVFSCQKLRRRLFSKAKNQLPGVWMRSCCWARSNKFNIESLAVARDPLAAAAELGRALQIARLGECAGVRSFLHSLPRSQFIRALSQMTYFCQSCTLTVHAGDYFLLKLLPPPFYVLFCFATRADSSQRD
jgi:hypothetical protein